MKVGDNVDANATLTPADAGTLNYTSNNSSVIKVENGNLIAVGEGTATVIVSFVGNNKYNAAENKTIAVTVSLNDVTVSAKDMELKVSENKTINYTTTPPGLNVTFVVDDSGVVNVDADGTVVALKEGNATITINVGDNKVYAMNSTTINVTVNKISTAIEVNTTTMNLKVNKQSLINATLTPTDAGNLTYTSSNNTVAVVVDGKIKALAEGSAVIIVSFNGTDKYAAAESKNITVTVTLNDASVSVEKDTLELFVDENSTIVATTTPEGLNVTFIPDDSGVISVDENGIVTALKEGTAPIIVKVGGDGIYAENSTTVTVTVSKIPTEVILQNDTIKLEVGDETDADASIMLSNAGNLTYTSSDEDVATVDADGKITAVGEGNATITVSFAGNKKYTASNATITVTISKVAFEPEVATNDTTVTVSVPEDATGNITLTVGNETFTAPITDGVAIFDISDVPSGDYNATISYPGNDKYEGFEFEYPISIEDQFIISADNLTKYYKGPERFAVNLTDSKGKPIVNATVNININGASYNKTTNSNGQASMAINLNSGKYPVVVTYNGTSVDATITVLATVNGTDVVKMYRNGTQYYATFLDIKGNYLADGTAVNFNINGVMYERKVSGNKGLARLNINLEPGEYIITAINPETREMASNNITVLPVLTENRDITKYYRNGTQYTVKVLDADGKAVGAGVAVRFNINGVFYERTTNESGIARLNLNLQPGDYVITAEYKGSMVSNNIKVLPILNATDITMKYRDGTQFKANLVDGHGKPCTGQKVQFNIHGVFYDRVTDGNGQAKLNINLMPGEYIITSSYNGSSISSKITIRG